MVFPAAASSVLPAMMIVAIWYGEMFIGIKDFLSKDKAFISVPTVQTRMSMSASKRMNVLMISAMISMFGMFISVVLTVLGISYAWIGIIVFAVLMVVLFVLVRNTGKVEIRDNHLCPICGAKLSEKEDYKVCDKCGFTKPDRKE